MKDIIKSEAMMDVAAFQEWEREQRRDEPRPVDGLLSAAANDPIGLHILARRLVFKESYQEAVEHLSSVTHLTISNGAARVRVHRLTRTLADTLT